MEKNKILLVAGASSDLGCALIRKTADQYDRILAHYCRSGDRLEELKEELGEKLQLIQADFMEEESTAEMIKKIREEGQMPTHMVFLSAPGFYQVKFAKTSWEQFQQGISTSLRSAMMLGQALIPGMAKQKFGRVVFMLSSCVQNVPPKYLSPYVTVKYGMLGLMKSLAAEYADKGVTVNGISPDMIETRFLTGIPDLVIEKNAMDSPIKRNLTVEDVLPLMEYLLSDASEAVTGQNLAITGGRG